jgi:hypothetical protein
MWEASKAAESVGPGDCSGPETKSHPTNFLTSRRTKIDLDLHLHGCSQVSQELFVRDRRNVNVPGYQNESTSSGSRCIPSQPLTTSNESVRRCAPNVRYTILHESSSFGSLSTVRRKQENLVEYCHPVPSADRKDIALEVECGTNRGLLYPSLLCQGSKGACILFQKTWLTPNQFQAASGRGSAKDWKRSIRHCGRSVKLLMSRGVLTQNPVCHCQTGSSISTTSQVSKQFRYDTGEACIPTAFYCVGVLFKVTCNFCLIYTSSLKEHVAV